MPYPLAIVILFILAAVTTNQLPNSSYIKGISSTNWQSEKVILQGDKELSLYKIEIGAREIRSHDTLSMRLNLNGLCLLPAKASEVSFTNRSNQIYSVSLRDYVENCSHKEQTIVIPLEEFFHGPPPDNLSILQIQFWYPTMYQIDLLKVDTYNRVLGSSTTRVRPTRSPRPTPPASPVTTPSPTVSPMPTTNIWEMRSVSSMKESKDRVCNQRDAVFIDNWVSVAKQLNITHISIETPYDNPECGNSLGYTNLWVEAIRRHGLKVWHRHMPLAFEGIYNTPKNTDFNYISQIVEYIKANPTLFAPGDIFTPIPEPQNGGIYRITYCPYNKCIFSSKEQFNQWLRDAMTLSNEAFSSIGLSNSIGIGYYGFDGFVAWGDNNPDWSGILEDSTVNMMGNITIDHYPEIVGDTMQNDLNELQSRYPSVPIVVGEWGTITGGDIQKQVTDSMSAAQKPGVVGFGYWHLGTGGNEALVRDDLTPRQQYDEVQSFFNSQ